MATRTCPHCGQEKDARGFQLHVASCKEKTRRAALRERYTRQLAGMTAVQAERFLRKAGG
jgi:hypothetical protein